jgi:hypothetical protein
MVESWKMYIHAAAANIMLYIASGSAPPTPVENSGGAPESNKYWSAWPERLKHCEFSKPRWLLTILQGVTFQKKWIFFNCCYCYFCSLCKSSILYTHTKKELHFKNLSVFMWRAGTGCIIWLSLPWAVVSPSTLLLSAPLVAHLEATPIAHEEGVSTAARSKRFIDPGCTSQEPSAPPSATEA